MNDSFWPTNAQQAPPDARQSSAEPDQTASTSAHRATGTAAAATTSVTTAVMTTSSGVATLRRTNASSLAAFGVSVGAVVTSSTGTQQPAVVGVHCGRDDETQREIHDDHDEHRLDRVSRLIRRRVEDADEIGKPDRHGEARVLREAHPVGREQRYHRPHG